MRRPDHRSIVVVEPVGPDGADIDQIEIGDVVTFMPRPQDPTLVTHRVTSIGQNAEGDVALFTRGDANDQDDADPVTSTQLRGVVRYDVPWVGRLANLLTETQRRIGVLVVVAALLGYALFHAVRAFRRPGGRQRTERDVTKARD